MEGHVWGVIRKLGAAGIDARVLALHTVKPLDEPLVLKAAEETGALVTCEEASTMRGLGSAVAKFLGARHPVPVLRIGVSDRFAETGPCNDLLHRYRMSVLDIVEAAKRAIIVRDR